jgi:hypothetical protein
MTELEQTFAKLADAIQRDDEKAGREAIIALASVTIGAVLRIADALEHIGRNLPVKGDAA